METNKNLTTALVACIATCEEIGIWSDNAEDCIAPIDGQPFRDCSDLCSLSLRLCLRSSSYSEKFLKLSRSVIESCIESGVAIIESGLNTDIEIELAQAITNFDHTLIEIQNFLGAKTGSLNNWTI